MQMVFEMLRFIIIAVMERFQSVSSKNASHGVQTYHCFSITFSYCKFQASTCIFQMYGVPFSLILSVFCFIFGPLDV